MTELLTSLEAMALALVCLAGCNLLLAFGLHVLHRQVRKASAGAQKDFGFLIRRTEKR